MSIGARLRGIIADAYQAVAGVVTVIEDLFTAADTTTISGRTPSPTNTPGNNWVLQFGTMAVTSNAMVPSSTGRAVIGAGTADCTVSATLKHGSSTVRNPAVYFRANTSTSGLTNAATSLWYVGLISGTGVVLVEVNAGVATTRASSAKVISLSTAYLVEVILNGTSITVKVDGVVECTFTSSFLQTNQLHGIGGVGTSATGITIDNFKVTVP